MQTHLLPIHYNYLIKPISIAVYHCLIYKEKLPVLDIQVILSAVNVEHLNKQPVLSQCLPMSMPIEHIRVNLVCALIACASGLKANHSS